jgi:uncharacterized membrane protein
MARPAVADRPVELALARLLQIGVVSAALVVLAGGLRYLTTHGGEHPQYGTFTGEPDDLSRVGGIVRAAAALRGRGMIQLGLLLLLGTPVARVAFSLVAFALQRDRIYVILTAIVLVLLLASLTGTVA